MALPRLAVGPPADGRWVWPSRAKLLAAGRCSCGRSRRSRFRADRVGASSSASGVTVVAWTVIGFDGLAGYPDLAPPALRASRRIAATRSSGWRRHGRPPPAGGQRGSRCVVGGALLGGCVLFARREDEPRSFTCAVVATLALSPIVWLHYLGGPARADVHPATAILSAMAPSRPPLDQPEARLCGGRRDIRAGDRSSDHRRSPPRPPAAARRRGGRGGGVSADAVRTPRARRRPRGQARACTAACHDRLLRRASRARPRAVLFASASPTARTRSTFGRSTARLRTSWTAGNPYPEARTRSSPLRVTRTSIRLSRRLLAMPLTIASVSAPHVSRHGVCSSSSRSRSRTFSASATGAATG